MATTTSNGENKTKKGMKDFQYIPHWNDPNIGYKALLREIKTYVNYKHDEFVRLAPVVSKDEFIWDTFCNMLRRNGYPQYDDRKNLGNFHSYVQTNCVRNQIDWARKRNVRFNQMAKLQNRDPEEILFDIELDEFIMGSDDCTKHEKIRDTHIWEDSEDLILDDILKNVSDDKISEKFAISWKQFTALLAKGWSIVDISKQLELNPTTVRKYHAQLKHRLLEDSNVKELLSLSGIQIESK